MYCDIIHYHLRIILKKELVFLMICLNCLLFHKKLGFTQNRLDYLRILLFLVSMLLRIVFKEFINQRVKIKIKLHSFLMQCEISV